MTTEVLMANSNLLQLQARLTKFTYLSKESLPGIADALIFQKLRQSRKMPTKQRYFNLYHWYLTMSQFASKQIQRWANSKDSIENDKLIVETLTTIQNFKCVKGAEADVNYKVNVILNDQIPNCLISLKNKLGEQIGQQYMLISKILRQLSNANIQRSNKAFVISNVKLSEQEKLKDLISKWAQIQKFQIEKICSH